MPVNPQYINLKVSTAATSTTTRDVLLTTGNICRYDYGVVASHMLLLTGHHGTVPVAIQQRVFVVKNSYSGVGVAATRRQGHFLLVLGGHSPNL